jgi:kynurenine formamidase
MHNVLYVGHSNYQKTIAAIRSQYFWPGMKKDVADYIAKCMEYQRVKVGTDIPMDMGLDDHEPPTQAC